MMAMSSKHLHAVQARGQLLIQRYILNPMRELTPNNALNFPAVQ